VRVQAPLKIQKRNPLPPPTFSGVSWYGRLELTRNNVQVQDAKRQRGVVRTKSIGSLQMKLQARRR